jgi:Phage integrase protein
MERHLARMLDTLVQLAIAHGSTVLADHLRGSINQHGQQKLTTVTFRMVTEAARSAAAPLHPDHAIGALLRPRAARRLKGERITTLGELVAFCNRRGANWWRSIPRIGPGRAPAIVTDCGLSRHHWGRLSTPTPPDHNVTESDPQLTLRAVDAANEAFARRGCRGSGRSNARARALAGARKYCRPRPHGVGLKPALTQAAAPKQNHSTASGTRAVVKVRPYRNVNSNFSGAT